MKQKIYFFAKVFEKLKTPFSSLSLSLLFFSLEKPIRYSLSLGGKHKGGLCREDSRIRFDTRFQSKGDLTAFMLAAILPIKSIFLPLFIFAERKKISEKDKYFFLEKSFLGL